MPLIVIAIFFSKTVNFNLSFTGLPHTHRTQGIFKLKKISGNFDLFVKLGETQGSFDFP